jgi:hypothetical protein
MRAGMPCTLLAASVWACASLPAAAQVNPTTAQSPQSSLERTPPLPKSLQSLEPIEKNSMGFWSLLRGSQARSPQILQAPSPEQTEATAELPRTCAHILIYVAAPSADDKMMIKLPKDDSNSTPTYQGLPPCSRDFRPLFFAALGPAFRFMKPGRTDSPPAGSEKPSSLTQPK